MRIYTRRQIKNKHKNVNIFGSFATQAMSNFYVFRLSMPQSSFSRIML